jgi:aminomethyltransferase
MSTASPFAAVERQAGAVFAERFGLSLPEHFGDPEAEYRAARQALGLVDLSFRGVLSLGGSERLRWLNGQITNEVKGLGAGQGVLAAALNVKGRILADLAVYGRPDSVWIDLPRQRADVVRQTFDRHIIADDVTVADLCDRLAHLMVVGPEAPSCLAGLVGEAAAALRPWQHAEVSIAGAPATLVAADWLKLPEFDLLFPVGAAETVWRTLAERGGHPVGMAALDRLRIEAGWPWYGVDFDEENLLLEALSPAHVSFTKGCYLGQEVVIRIEHQGHLNKKLCGLTVSGDACPARGAAIFQGDRKVGQVTSATHSPALSHVIALGYLRRECWDSGTRLHMDINGQRLDAEVVNLPFVSA